MGPRIRLCISVGNGISFQGLVLDIVLEDRGFVQLRVLLVVVIIITSCQGLVGLVVIGVSSTRILPPFYGISMVFMEFLDLLWMCLAISAHRLPTLACASTSIFSSSSLQLSFCEKLNNHQKNKVTIELWQENIKGLQLLAPLATARSSIGEFKISDPVFVRCYCNILLISSGLILDSKFDLDRFYCTPSVVYYRKTYFQDCIKEL